MPTVLDCLCLRFRVSPNNTLPQKSCNVSRSDGHHYAMAAELT
jgi:hypothetical protein